MHGRVNDCKEHLVPEHIVSGAIVRLRYLWNGRRHTLIVHVRQIELCSRQSQIVIERKGSRGL